jgi:hypothetical protein
LKGSREGVNPRSLREGQLSRRLSTRNSKSLVQTVNHNDHKRGKLSEKTLNLILRSP